MQDWGDKENTVIIFANFIHRARWIFKAMERDKRVYSKSQATKFEERSVWDKEDIRCKRQADDGIG